jgi:hypothetical protein
VALTPVRRAIEWTVIDTRLLVWCGASYTGVVGTGFAWNSSAQGRGVQLGGGAGIAYASKSARPAPAVHAEIGAGAWADSGLRIRLRYERAFGDIPAAHVLVLAGIRLQASD